MNDVAARDREASDAGQGLCGCGHPRYQHLNEGDYCKAPFTGPGPRCTCMRFTSHGEPPRSEDGPIAYFLRGEHRAGAPERTTRVIPHPPSCPCPTCRHTEIQARIAAEQARKAIPERTVHWRWLHGPTPPEQQESPHQIAERRYRGYTYGRTA